MALNPNIILSGKIANPLEAMSRGMEVGDAQNVLRRRDELERAYQQHGEGALAGNPESLNALARLGDFKNPTSIQAHRQDMAFNREEMEFKRAKNRREAADWAREVSAEAAAAEQEKLSRILMGAAAFHAKGDKEGYDNHLRTYGLDPNEYPMGNFVSHAASMTGTIEGIKEVRELMAGPKPDYVTLNDQLVDRNAQGGPAVVPVQGMQPGSQVDVKGESDLRKEFTGEKPVKAFTEQASAYGRIVASAKDPSPAGDLAMIFNYMKVLDPGSVVRESEFATAESAARWLQESEQAGINVPRPVASAIRKVATGLRLSPEQRQDFLSRAGSIYSQSEQQHEQLAGQYGQIATEYGLEPARVVPDYRYKAEGAPPMSARPRMAPGRETVAPATQPAPQQEISIPAEPPEAFVTSPDVTRALEGADGVSAKDIWDNMSEDAKRRFLEAMSNG